MTSNLTIKGKNFNPELVTISDKPSVMDSGAKYVYVGYKGKNLVVQTPLMDMPFGLNLYDKGDYPKYSVELSFRNMENDKNLQSFYDNLQKFDEKLIDEGVKNQLSWLKKKNQKRAVIEGFFNRQIKVPVDKNGDEQPQYPHRMRLKIPVREGKCECEFYDTKRNKLDKPLEDILVKNAKAKVIMQCVGLWVSSSNYMCQWKAVRMEVDIPAGAGEIDFLPDTDDEGEEQGGAAPTPDGKTEKVVSEDESDDEDDASEDDDESVEESSEEDEPEPEPVKKSKGKGKGKKAK